jgi:hypothetical protein
MAKKATAVKELPSTPAPLPFLDGERRSRKGRSDKRGPKAHLSAAAENASPYEIRVSFRSLRASTLNYRSSFDPIKLEELKDEIARQGLSHNLVARPAGEPDLYEVLVGGRRLKALGLLVAEGRWDAEAPIVPIQVRPGLTDLEAIVLAMGENNHRDDVHYLEEAEGIRRAIDEMTQGKGPSRKDRTTARLAAQLGLGQRWVQILHSLAMRLHPEVKAFIQDRGLSLDHAKAFAVVPPERQVEMLPKLQDCRGLQPSTIRDWLTQDLPPLDNALFDTATYKGALTQVGLFANPVSKSKASRPGSEDSDELDEDGPEVVEEHFLDVDQYSRLQRAAIDQLRGALATQYAFVEVCEGHRIPEDFSYAFGTKDDETGIVLLQGPDLSVRRVECKRNVTKAPPAAVPRTQGVGGGPRPAPPASGLPAASSAGLGDPNDPDSISSSDGPPDGDQDHGDADEAPAGPENDPADDALGANPFLTKHVYLAHREKTRHLQAALLRSPAHAMRMAIIGLLGMTSSVRVATQEIGDALDWTLAPELEAKLHALRLTLGEELLDSPFMPVEGEAPRYSPNLVRIDYHHIWNEKTPAHVLSLLADLPDAEVAEILALLVALRTGSFCNHSPKFGDEPVIVKLSEMLGLERAAASVDDDFLKGYRKSGLLAVAQECGVDDPKLPRRTMAEIRAAILASPGLASFQPAELVFAETHDIERRLPRLAVAQGGPPTA